MLDATQPRRRKDETVSEPPSPQQAYFDKYPKRTEPREDKHVTIEFPTIPERKPSSSRHGLRDWRVVQAHLEPRAAPRPRRKENGKIRDPDDMVIVSHADDRPRRPHTSHVPPSPSMSGFRSSLISSAGTSEPGALTPPRTPTSPHEPVVIASSSVEAMDALIDSMGAGASLDSMSFLSPSTYKRNSRFGYPLYQPPLPTPPDGVKLGVDGEWKSRLPRPSPKRERWRYDEDPTRDSSSSFGSTPSRTGTPSTAASSRTGTPAPASRGSTPAPSSSSAPGSSASTPTPGTQPTWLQDDPFIVKKPVRIKSDEEIEADERADVTSPLVPPRARQRSGASVRTAKSLRSVSGRTISTSSTSSVHKARGIPRSPAVWDLAETESIKERAVVPSIDDIIRMHAPAVEAATKAASKRGSSTTGTSSTTTSSCGESSGTPKITPSGHSRAVSLELDLARSSVDSIADEAQRALQVVQPPVSSISPRRPSTSGSYIPRLHHARSFPKSVHSRDNKSVYSDGHYPRDVYSDTKSSYSHDAKSLYSRDVYDTQSLSPHFRPFSDGASICSGNSGNTVLPRADPRADNSIEMAQYLRSPRLTRLLTLRRPAHAGLTVSLADVGSLTGRPVIIYLGLGCVRYLVALYDEMAEALNLRLICVDRWGLGRTSDVPTDKRGLLEWAGVVEEVADTLGLARYSVLAHSAGAPYALAGALKAGERVFGSVHLLAPWVSMAVDGGYKWLKYVPNGLIKTAQAAEWRLQGWMIGKPPTIQYEGIGFDASAPTGAEPRPSFSSFSEYDELDDFQGRFSGGTEEERREKEEKGKGREREDKGKGKETREGKGKEREERPKAREDKTKGKKKEVSELGERPRKGSKSIFGGLFNNSLPRNSPKRGLSTPPSAFVKPGDGAEDGLEVADDAEPVTPTADSPTTPVPTPAVSVPATPTPHARQPKLKGLRSMSSLKSQAKSEPAKRANVGLGLGLDDEDHKARTHAWASDFGDDPMGSRPAQRRSLSLNTRPLPTSPAPPSPRSPNPPKTVTLASALLQASHAESLKGGTADLLSILERDSKPWGFSYADVRQPVRVWYGDRDDKIGVGSVRWMERVMKSCEVKIVKGAGHSLMTHAEVVVEVLESIAREWDERSQQT